MYISRMANSKRLRHPIKLKHSKNVSDITLAKFNLRETVSNGSHMSVRNLLVYSDRQVNY